MAALPRVYSDHSNINIKIIRIIFKNTSNEVFFSFYRNYFEISDWNRNVNLPERLKYTAKQDWIDEATI